MKRVLLRAKHEDDASVECRVKSASARSCATVNSETRATAVGGGGDVEDAEDVCVGRRWRMRCWFAFGHMSAPLTQLCMCIINYNGDDDDARASNAVIN